MLVELTTDDACFLRQLILRRLTALKDEHRILDMKPMLDLLDKLEAPKE